MDDVDLLKERKILLKDYYETIVHKKGLNIRLKHYRKRMEELDMMLMEGKVVRKK